jgi:hypothetical protein
MTIRELLEELGIHPEDSGREMVQYLLEQRGYKCTAESLRLDPRLRARHLLQPPACFLQ